MTTSRMTDLGALLKRLRAAARLTQEELAERAQMSVRAVGDLERGVRRAPHNDTIELLITALGPSADDAALLRMVARHARWPQLTTPATPTAQATAGRIHAPLSPLIGREREEAAIIHLLARTDTRLLTLTGPAGIGKTRLAQQAITVARANFAGGAIFIGLAALPDHTFVLAAIARALGIGLNSALPLSEQLGAALANQELLLVLDNFEHVTPAAPAIADILTTCPGVKALVTSRAALHLHGEQEFAVPPLDTPDLAHLPPLDDLAGYSAVALFVRRAQAVRSSFALTPALAPTVAAITVRLDGLPLAIELAAARIKLLTPHALLTRLEASMSLLSAGAVDLPERQRTMRTAIAWSHELLPEPERRLFRRLAVFDGGWTLEATEAICADTPADAERALDHLAALVDKSLVVVGNGAENEPRFRLLRLIKDFALERLVEADEETMMRRRHADYYGAFAAFARKKLLSAEQAAWYNSIEQEHANLRAALRWAMAQGDVAVGLRTATNLWPFWQARGYSTEGRDWLHRLLAQHRATVSEPGSESDIALWAGALSAAGNLAWNQSDYTTSSRLLDECLRLYRQLGDTAGIAFNLNTLGLIADERGQRDEAVRLFEEAAPLFEAASDTIHVAMVYDNLATVAMRRQDYSRAITLYERALALQRELGVRQEIANTLANLGYTMYASGALTRAAQLLTESLSLFDESGDMIGKAYALDNLSEVLLAQGATGDAPEASPAAAPAAANLQRQAFVVARELGAPRLTCMILDSATQLAIALRLPAQAARLMALATTLRDRLQAVRPEGERIRYEAELALLQATLGLDLFTPAWEQGRAMTLDDAESVLAMLETTAQHAPADEEEAAQP
ncbi:MAG TPA: tetratricopeptide repeat protein [Ktedonobacterales bacterium]|nr:tetratricopeptide repeat protein [Ktedonobacterales bacterium]